MGIGRERALTHLAILQGQMLAQQGERDGLRRQIGQQSGVALIDPAIGPVVANAIRIAVATGQSALVGTALIVATPEVGALQHGLFHHLAQT